MAKAILPIQPFPADTDRRDFGHWLSGMTDGEGCFQLRLQPRNRPRAVPTPVVNFCMELRSDDLPILRTIQSFFGCGRIFHTDREAERSAGKRYYDSYRFAVSCVAHLASIIVPHFDAFPLRAKKRADFVVWKQGVLLFQQVTALPRRGIVGRGSRPRWTEEPLARFRALAVALRKCREPDPASLPTLPPPRPADPSLFD